MRSAVVSVLLLTLCLAGGSAAAAPVALVIGNADHPQATALRNPLNDARDMADRLRSLRLQVAISAGHRTEVDRLVALETARGCR